MLQLVCKVGVPHIVEKPLNVAGEDTDNVPFHPFRLDEFNKEEVLSENDAWYCPRCKEHRRASKKFELWKTPDILVMHLKRFSASRGFRDKLDVLVDFPVEGLDMTGRVEAPEPGESLVYDLFAVDNHYGGLGGGHYTAYAKNFMSGEWNEYNGELGLFVCLCVLYVNGG